MNGFCRRIVQAIGDGGFERDRLAKKSSEGLGHDDALPLEGELYGFSAVWERRTPPEGKSCAQPEGMGRVQCGVGRRLL